jgi:hypothetical protein
MPQFQTPHPVSTVSTMEILIGMIGSITSTIERLSLSTRLAFPSSLPSSLHSHIMDITLTDTTRTIPMGTAVTGDTVTAVNTTSWRRSVDLLAPDTITVQSMGSWGLKPGEQFALMNAITVNLGMAQSNGGPSLKTQFPEPTKT